jgi:hypothetical protein
MPTSSRELPTISQVIVDDFRSTMSSLDISRDVQEWLVKKGALPPLLEPVDEQKRKVHHHTFYFQQQDTHRNKGKTKDETREDKRRKHETQTRATAGLSKTRQDKTRQDKTRQDKTRWGNVFR